jgi:dihydrolipoamide dehydrogenase
MNPQEYDVAIIGSGPGGYVAAVRSAQQGFKTVCIEKRKTLGGTCLNVGCIPSKALLQSTEVLQFINKHAGEHGVNVGKTKADFPAMMRRKEEVVKGLTDGVQGIFKRHNIDWVHGEAKLTGHHQVQVKTDKGEENITARHILLATGSEPIALPFLPFDEKNIVTSTGALALESIPEKMVVVGAGYIGLELVRNRCHRRRNARPDLRHDGRFHPQRTFAGPQKAGIELFPGFESHRR